MSCITCAASSMLSLAHKFGPLAPLINLDDLMTYLECVVKLFLNYV
jgi:hypothetical protein